MSRWRIDSFEVEISGDSWRTEADGDRAAHRPGIGAFYVPEGVGMTRLDSPTPRGGLYAPRDVPMTDGGFEVLRWTADEIESHERYNGAGSFREKYVPVTVDYSDDV